MFTVHHFKPEVKPRYKEEQILVLAVVTLE